LLPSKRNIRTWNTLRPTKVVSDPPSLGEDVIRDCARVLQVLHAPILETGGCLPATVEMPQFVTIDTNLDACAHYGCICSRMMREKYDLKALDY